MKHILIIGATMAFFVPVYGQQTLSYQLTHITNANNNNGSYTIYFGEGYEELSHFSIHMLIAMWKPKYSLIAAVAIETADTLNGRFDQRDWGARLVGVFVGFVFNQYLFNNHNIRRIKWKN